MSIQELFDKLKSKYPNGNIRVTQCLHSDNSGYTLLQVDDVAESTCSDSTDEQLLEQIDAHMPTNKQRRAKIEKARAELVAKLNALDAQIEPLTEGAK